MCKTPSGEKHIEDGEKVKYGKYRQFLDEAEISLGDPAKAFCHLRRAFPTLDKELAAEIVAKWSREKQGRSLTGEQNLAVRRSLSAILETAITLERNEDLTGVGKKLLEEIKKQAHEIARIFRQGKPQNCKTVFKGVLNDLKGIKGLLS